MISNALDHLDAAYENGCHPFATGCHVVIGDGLKGTDEMTVPIDGEYVKEVKIGRAIMDADIIISLTHFKGHEATGFGGGLFEYKLYPGPATSRNAIKLLEYMEFPKEIIEQAELYIK